MGVTVELKIKIECDKCGVPRVTSCEGGFLGGTQTDEADEISEAILQADLDGWETRRASYEEMETICPTCQKLKEVSSANQST